MYLQNVERLRFMNIHPQLVQLYQIIHIHPVTIFNNEFRNFSLVVVITFLLHHKENEDQREFMNACFEGAIYKFALTYQRGNN